MKNTRKILALLLTIVMLAGMLPMSALATGGTWSGEGTAASPYLIEDADDLLALSTSINAESTNRYKYFRLMSDIEVTGWEPIGYSSSYYFAGDFDGNGFTITINGISSTKQQYSTNKYYGLFGYSYARIHDLSVAGAIDASDITSTVYAGGVAAYSYGSSSYKSVIANCSSSMTITLNTTNGVAGGIVGYATSNYNYIYSCYGNGSITAYRKGGIIGSVNSGNFVYNYTPAELWCGYGSTWGSVTECYDATTWSGVADADAWVTAANASAASYSSVTDFWSLASGGTPEHATCAHQHADEDAGDVTAPNCTEKGYTTYTCSLCSKSYKADFTDALDHTWVAGDTVAPTCTEDGYTNYSCFCGATKRDNTVTAIGHDFTVQGETVAPTCTEAGYTVYTCSHSGCTETEHKDIVEALNHDYDENGICTRCNAKKLESFSDFFYGMDDSLTAENDAAYPWTAADNTYLVSGNAAVNSSEGTIKITALKGGTLDFDYVVSSESNYDGLRIYKNESCVNYSSSSATAWKSGFTGTASGSYTLELVAGDIVKLCYYKDTSTNKNDDCVKLSNIVFTPETTHEHSYAVTCNGDGTHTKACSDASCGDTLTEACDTLGANGECSVCGYTTAAGSKWNPIEISDAAGLQALADAVNGGDSKAGVYYEITNDITLPASFTPIGTYTWGPDNIVIINGVEVNNREPIENSFAGHFNGKGHTVTLNLTDRTGSDARVGLFGSVAGSETERAVIENVIVAGSVTAYGGSCIGGLVGLAKGYADIINCGNAAAVTNASELNGAAGLVGRVGTITGADGTVTITGCFNVGTVTAFGYAGGIVYDVESNDGLTITNCYDMGKLTATAETGFAGGIVACGGTKTISITGCYAGGTYSAVNAGAVIGTASPYYTSISGTYYPAGGKWYGGSLTWSNTPSAFSDYASLLSSLGDGFKANADSYPLLAWQSGAAAPSEAHEHSYTDAVTAPTCTEKGFTTHTCACGYSYSDTFTDALGHSESADCTTNNDGTHSYVCTECQGTVSESCTFGEGTVTTQPAYGVEGVKTYTCTKCGYEKTETVAALPFSSGDGSEASPYKLNNAADMASLSALVNGGESFEGSYFELTADVTMSDWTAIGTAAKPFSGHFNGGGHSVTIMVNDAEKDFNGLFGAVRNAVIERVVVKGSVTGGSFTAGVAGYAASSIIRYCGSEATVTGGNNHTFAQNQGPNDSYVGGVVGYAASSRIVACYNKGAVKNNGDTDTSSIGKSQYAGGIAGDLYDNSSVQYSYNTGAVTATGTTAYTYTGGIAGMAQTSGLMNCYSTGTINGNGQKYTGGIIGSGNLYYQQSAFSYYLTGSAASGAGGAADSANYISFVTADDLKNAESTTRQNLGANFSADSGNVNGGYPVLSWEVTPGATVAYITEIRSAADMREFANNVRGGYDYAGKTVKLMNDIDLQGFYNSESDFGNIWTAIGDVNGTVFAGTFDGQSNTISNMCILNSNSGYLGLFSALPEGAKVKNLTVTGLIRCAQSSVGSIVGWNLGTVENCVSEVNIDVSACDYVGGIVADNAGTVKNCTNRGGIDGNGLSNYVGGVIGHCEPAYDTSYNALVVPSLSGLVNYGDVTGYEYVGGIIGGMFNEDASVTSITVSGCYNGGNVSGSENVGGIAGSANLSELILTDCYYAIGSAYQSVGSSGGENYSRPVSSEYAGSHLSELFAD